MGESQYSEGYIKTITDIKIDKVVLPGTEYISLITIYEISSSMQCIYHSDRSFKCKASGNVKV